MRQRDVARFTSPRANVALYTAQWLGSKPGHRLPLVAGSMKEAAQVVLPGVRGMAGAESEQQ